MPPPLVKEVDVLAGSRQVMSELDQLAKFKQKLNMEDAVSYLKRFSVLFIQAAQHPGKDLEKTSDNLFTSLQTFARVCPDEIEGFLGGEHGVVVLGRKALSIGKERGDNALRAYFFHNAVHWGGFAECIDPRPAIRNVSVRFGEFSAAFTPRGELVCNEKLLVELIKSLPHAVPGFVPEIKIKGQARLTLAQAFVLLRNASDSAHALTLRRTFSGFGRALSNKRGIERALTRLTDRGTFKKRRAEFLKNYHKEEGLRMDKKKFVKIFRDNVKNEWYWAGRGLIHPSKKEKILKDLLNKDYAKFGYDHIMVISRVAGVPLDYAENVWHKYVERGVIYGKERARIVNELFSFGKPMAPYTLEIDMSKAPRVAEVKTIGGLGVPWSKMFPGLMKGTSAKFRGMVAKETLQFPGKDAAHATVRFKKIRRAA
ncbi:MAG: hypothetical protein V1676_05295 [Candidatus Diapherotrites archaeon]